MSLSFYHKHISWGMLLEFAELCRCRGCGCIRNSADWIPDNDASKIETKNGSAIIDCTGNLRRHMLRFVVDDRIRKEKNWRMRGWNTESEKKRELYHTYLYILLHLTRGKHCKGMCPTSIYGWLTCLPPTTRLLLIPGMWHSTCQGPALHISSQHSIFSV